MKRKSMRWLVCAAAMVMVFSMGACSSDSDSDKDSDTKTESSSRTENDATEEPEETESAKLYASMEEMVNSEEVQAQVESMRSSAEAQGMSISILAEGDKMVYFFKYNDLVVEEGDGVAEALEKGIASTESVYFDTAKSLKELVDVENPVVVVEYLDANGTMVYSREFSAEEAEASDTASDEASDEETDAE